MKWVMLLPILAGGVVVAQLSLASVAQKSLGPAALVLISGFSTGAVGAVIFLMLPRPELSVRAVWYAVGTGVLGALIVASMAMAAGQIGLARALSLIIASQLILGFVADRIGLFGVMVQGFSWTKLVGIMLIVTGGVLVTRS